jgi:hypothetical protein
MYTYHIGFAYKLGLRDCRSAGRLVLGPFTRLPLGTEVAAPRCGTTDGSRHPLQSFEGEVNLLSPVPFILANAPNYF